MPRQSTLEYQYYWVSAAAEELATLAFYVWVGVNFRPHQENRYFKLTDEELREVELCGGAARRRDARVAEWVVCLGLWLACARMCRDPRSVPP